MALPTGVAGVFAPVNIAGVLLNKTDTRVPLFNMLGGSTIASREFLVGAEYELAAAGDAAISEDASVTAPTPSYDTPTQAKNVTEIHHKAVRATYRKMSNTDALTGLHLAGQSNNVQNPLAFAIANRSAEMRNDFEWALLNQTYNLATTSAEVDKTRGLNAAITSNTVAAASAELGWDMLMTLAKAMTATSPYGLEGVRGVLNGEQVVQLQKMVTEQGIKISPSLAGANLYDVQTPFGNLTFLQGGHRMQPNGTAGFYRLGSCKNVFEPVPGLGAIFYEKLSKTGATEHGQIYAQWGLDHGHEWLHGKITGLATTTTATTAPKVFITNDASNPVSTDEVS